MIPDHITAKATGPNKCYLGVGVGSVEYHVKNGVTINIVLEKGANVNIRAEGDE